MASLALHICVQTTGTAHQCLQTSSETWPGGELLSIACLRSFHVRRASLGGDAAAELLGTVQTGLWDGNQWAILGNVSHDTLSLFTYIVFRGGKTQITSDITRNLSYLL
jgi:hypothetical protein